MGNEIAVYGEATPISVVCAIHSTRADLVRIVYI